MTVEMALVGGAHIHTPGFITRLNKREDVHVKYVWDHNRERAQRRADDLNTQVCNDLDIIWEDKAISSVVICSETCHHKALVLEAAAAGKHMFVEKPLGMEAEDAYTMAEAIEAAGVLFQTGYFMRGQPIYRFLKAQIAEGALGTITRCQASNCHAGSLKGWFDTEWRWMADVAQAGCGAFGDLGTHMLDIMLWLLGNVGSVTARLEVATGRYGACDEYGEGMLAFAEGTIGTLAAGWVDLADPVKLLMSGTEGHATVINGQLYFLSDHVAGADGQAPWRDLPSPWPHAFELFIDAVLGKPDAPLVTPREAAYRSAVMAAMYQAAEEQTWIVV